MTTKQKAEYKIYPGGERGQMDADWLSARHSFSFARYYDPERMGFGALRVLNDDTIAPGKGFGFHPHEDMEIITVPLSGSLEHEDNLGNHGLIQSGEVQVMSAGTGIVHSEVNPSVTEPVQLFQIWIEPSRRGVQPRYDQAKLTDIQSEEGWSVLVGPEGWSDGLWVHQDAWISSGVFKENNILNYTSHNEKHWLYLMVIEGRLQVGDQLMRARDALAVKGSWLESVEVREPTRVLMIEVPRG